MLEEIVVYLNGQWNLMSSIRLNCEDKKIKIKDIYCWDKASTYNGNGSKHESKHCI